MSSIESFPRRRPQSGSLWLIWLVLVLLSAALLWRVWPPAPAGLNPNAAMRPVTPRGDLAAVEKTTIAIFRRCSPSVVYITTLVNTATDGLGFDVQQVPEGTGSGFVWDKQGASSPTST